MKFQIDSIDGHFMISGNEKLNHQDTEMLQGDLFLREAGQPDCFGLLFTDLDKREALTKKHRENALKHAHLIAAAPDLLEALRYLHSRLIDPENPDSQQWICSDSLHPDCDDKSVVDYLEEAIKKAEGRQK